MTNPTLLPAGTRIPVALGESVVLPSFDFETYSEAGFAIGDKVKGIGPQGKGGLPVVGTPMYVEHPSAEVLCLYYDLKDGLGRRGWMPGAPTPTDLLAHIAAGGLMEAWNITFEWYVWNMICVRKYGWPPLQLEQCYCAMSKSRRFSLPGALAKASAVLGTPLKDKAGTNLIQKLTRPHTPTKNRPAHRWTPATAWEDFVAFYRYCDRDVETEDHASARIPDLTAHEREIWLMDQRINARGVQVDTDALDAMLDILGQTELKYNARLVQITGGLVQAASELAQMQAWLRATQGLDMQNMQKDTITETLERGDLTPAARKVLDIRERLGAANIKKLRTLKLQTSSDGRLRDQYMYCGADRTGRWSAGGVQLQNMTSKGPKSCECEACGEFFGARHSKACPFCGSFMIVVCNDWTVDAVESALGLLLTRDLDLVERVWGDAITLMCGCLRGLFIAKPGHEFVCVDFSAIEAVVAACLARCQWRIDVFSTHGKIYEQSAANATGIPFEDILRYKEENGMHHPARKTIGKVRELAGGYGGWIGAWKNFGADEFMTDEEIKTDVLKWRDESPEIVEMWGGQYRWCGPGKWDYRPELFGIEGAVINAIRNPGECFHHIDLSYAVRDDILYCRLPSGRYLHYHKPRLTPCDDKLGRDRKRVWGAKAGVGPGEYVDVKIHDTYQISFEGYNSNSQKGPIGWSRQETYGARLFENGDQAISRDIQADALLRCEQAGYSIVMHTHDEGIAEVPIGFGSIDEMAAIMSQRPDWASWWPIRAAGWRHIRYQK